MNKANHPPYSRRGDDSGGLRAIRVVWISFRPSEPETGVRILHRPPSITDSSGSGALLRVPIVVVQHMLSHEILERQYQYLTNKARCV